MNTNVLEPGLSTAADPAPSCSTRAAPRVERTTRVSLERLARPMPVPVRTGLAGSFSGAGAGAAAAAAAAAAAGVRELDLLPLTLVFEALLTEHFAFWGFMPDEDTESPLAATAKGATKASRCAAADRAGGGGDGAGRGSSAGRNSGGGSSGAAVGGGAASAMAMSVEASTGTGARLG